jgi:hypothetical protein
MYYMHLDFFYAINYCALGSNVSLSRHYAFMEQDKRMAVRMRLVRSYFASYPLTANMAA